MYVITYSSLFVLFHETLFSFSSLFTVIFNIPESLSYDQLFSVNCSPDLLFVAYVLLAVTITSSGFIPFTCGTFILTCVCLIGNALFSNPVFKVVCSIVPAFSPT